MRSTLLKGGEQMFNKFPYTNLHQLNLDWILETIKKGIDEISTEKADILLFKALLEEEVNKIKEIQDEQYDLITARWEVLCNKLITSVIPQLITFGLTENGYFVAYIPKQWKDLIFYTDMDNVDSYPFGRLQLRYTIGE